MKTTPDPPPAHTPNQVVAYNLGRARQLRGWTQEEAAAELERHLGVRWSKATFSAAERSTSGGRTREFTADEITAFAQTFLLPIAWFFLPPPWSGYAVSAAPGAGVIDPDSFFAEDLLRLVFPADVEELAAQIAERIHMLGYDEGSRATYWRVLHNHLVGAVVAVAGRPTGGLTDRRARLRRAMAVVEAVGDLFDPGEGES